MRYFVGEIYSEQEIQDYIESIKNQSLDELFETYVENDKQLYHYDDVTYQEWREAFESVKNGTYDKSINPDFYTRQNLMIHAVADKFYAFDDDPVINKLVEQVI